MQKKKTHDTFKQMFKNNNIVVHECIKFLIHFAITEASNDTNKENH